MPRLPRIIVASRLALPSSESVRALDLLVVLELDLEQPDHLDGEAGRAGDADGGVLVGREDLLDVALGDEVAHRGAPVAGHHHAAGEGRRDDRGAVRREVTGMPWGTARRAGSRSGAWPAQEVGERRGARASGTRRQPARESVKVVTGRPSGRTTARSPRRWSRGRRRSRRGWRRRRRRASSLALGDVGLLVATSVRRPRLAADLRVLLLAASRVAIGRPTLGACSRPTACEPASTRGASARDQRLGGVAAVEQLADVRLACRAAARASAPAAATRARDVEDHRVPRRRGDRRRRTAQALAAEVGAGVLGRVVHRRARPRRRSSSRSIAPRGTSRW